MSNELDQDLRRLFANASEPLPIDELHARVMNRLHRGRGWHRMARSVLLALGGIFSGVASGITAPLRLRVGGKGLLALIVGALVSSLAMVGT